MSQFNNQIAPVSALRVMIFTLILVAWIHTLSDIYAPLQSVMASYFQVDRNWMQGSMAFFMLSVAFSQLFYGVYSDINGRRKAVLLGFFIMLMGNFVIVMASSFWVFTLGRIIQGLGAGVAAAMWRCILKDCFDGHQLVKMCSYVSLVFVIFISTAPMVGSLIATHLSWHWVFWGLLAFNFIILLSFYCGFPETHHQRSSDWSLATVRSTFKTMLTSPAYMGRCIAVLLTYGSFFAWFVAGSLIMTDTMGLNHVVFSQYSLMVCGGMMIISTIINQVSVNKLSSNILLCSGWILMVLGGLLMVIMSQWPLSLFHLFVPLAIFVLGSGLIYPNILGSIMAPYPKHAGYAGSLYGCIQILGAGLMSLLVAVLPEDSSIYLGAVFIIGGLGAIAFYTWAVRSDI